MSASLKDAEWTKLLFLSKPSEKCHASVSRYASDPSLFLVVAGPGCGKVAFTQWTSKGRSR